MKKKILILASLPLSFVNFRYELIKSLSKKDYLIHLAAPKLNNDLIVKQKFKSLNINFHDVYLSRSNLKVLYEIFTIFSIFFLIIKVRPHIFLGYTIKPVIWGALIAWFLRVRKRFVIVTGLGYVFTNRIDKKIKLIRLFVCFFYRIAFIFTNKIFFQNNDDKKLFIKLKLIKQNKKIVVTGGSGVNLQHFTKFKLPNEPIKFLLIARMLGNKGIREFAAAAKIIKGIKPNVLFSIVGGLEDNPDSITAQEIELWEKNEILTWHKHVEDVRPYIKKSHVFVLPSYREGTPRTVLEAMACGRPIITSNVPGCKHLVMPEKNGILVRAKSVDSLVKAMFKFINKEVDLNKMGEISYNIIQNYDVRKVNKKIIMEMEKI